jgi:hypothetical protein
VLWDNPYRCDSNLAQRTNAARKLSEFLFTLSAHHLADPVTSDKSKVNAHAQNAPSHPELFYSHRQKTLQKLTNSNFT